MIDLYFAQSQETFAQLSRNNCNFSFLVYYVELILLHLKNYIIIALILNKKTPLKYLEFI